MRLNRYPSAPTTPRKKGSPCGCFALLGILGALGAIALIVVVVFTMNLPAIALQFAGFQAVGQTETLLADAPPPNTPMPVQNARPATNNITLSDANLGTTQINLQNYLVTGTDNTGIPLAQAQFTPNDLRALCQQYTPYCSPNGAPLRNATLDLYNGGAILRGEVNLPQTPVWQPIGIVLQIVRDSRVSVQGVDIGGTLYALPPDNIGQLIRDVETRLNSTLQNPVTIAGTSYRIQTIHADAQRLTITLR